MEAEPYLASGLAPSLLPLLEPSAAPCSVGVDWGATEGPSTVKVTYDPDTGRLTDIREKPSSKFVPSGSDAVRRILRATSYACSRWFKILRAAICRERERQQKFRVEHGLSKNARIPYHSPSICDAEAESCNASEETLRCLYGDVGADYARDKFARAIDTGDMRAFKIRLIVIKARDSLNGTEMFKYFIDGMEKCISKAEEIAGCTPDPSPRRMSRAEKERKKRIAASLVQDIDHQDIEKGDVDKYSKECLTNSDGTPRSQEQENPISCNNDVDDKNVSKTKSKRKLKRENKNIKITDVTVTGKKGVTVTHGVRKRKSEVVRKVREYESVEEIISDIESGLIVPYKSVEEICSDQNAGVITESESILFTMALDIYNPVLNEGIDSESAMEMESERIEKDEEEPVEEEPRSDERKGSFSYNPNGFAGCDGNYSDNGWDDEE